MYVCERESMWISLRQGGGGVKPAKAKPPTEVYQEEGLTV